MRITAVTILLLVALVWSIHELPATLHTVHGTSMQPVLRAGQRIIVNRFAYRFAGPQVDDVIVFREPESERLAVKRLTRVADEPVYADGPVYYVTGDNRSESLDSRHFGAVTRNAIIGRVEFLGGVSNR